MKFWLCSLLAATIWQGREEPKKFRVIDIPMCAHPYSRFPSTVVRTKVQYETFLKELKDGDPLNLGKKFTEALKKSDVDFEKETLVLLRHDEPSTSTKVRFETPALKERVLTCIIKIEQPKYGHTDCLAFWCLAVIVDKTHVKWVELQVGESRTRYCIAE